MARGPIVLSLGGSYIVAGAAWPQNQIQKNEGHHKVCRDGSSPRLGQEFSLATQRERGGSSETEATLKL